MDRTVPLLGTGTIRRLKEGLRMIANLNITEVILVVAVALIQYGKALACIFAGGVCVAVTLGLLFKRTVAHGPLLSGELSF